MLRKVALIRGINVGGHKKFPKIEQVHMLQDLGFADTEVYLHTGNWIFSTTETNSALEHKFEEAIERSYGWNVSVIVRSASEMAAIMNACPFSEEKKKKSYFALLQQRPSEEKIGALEKEHYPGEEFHIAERCVYFYSEAGAAKAKLSTNFFEKMLKVQATSRNYNTMSKIVALTMS